MGNLSQSNLDIKAFEKSCGVGVVVTSEMIDTEVSNSIAEVKSELLEKRYKFNTGPLMAEVRKNLKWADGKAIRSEFDIQILDLLGPKTEADLAPVTKQEKKSGKDKKPIVHNTNSNEKSDKSVNNMKHSGKIEEDEGALTIAELMKTKVHLHKPGENYKTDGYVVEGMLL
jgi:glutaminyl-tRNA synthetase